MSNDPRPTSIPAVDLPEPPKPRPPTLLRLVYWDDRKGEYVEVPTHLNMTPHELLIRDGWKLVSGDASDTCLYTKDPPHVQPAAPVSVCPHCHCDLSATGVQFANADGVPGERVLDGEVLDAD